MPTGKAKGDTPHYKKSKCFWCGIEFTYKVPKKLIQRLLKNGEHTKFLQIFCSPQCENAFNRYCQKIEEAYNQLGNKSNRKIVRLVCPKCGLVLKKDEVAYCPRCKVSTGELIKLKLMEVIQ